jgi:cellulose synthase/poly-beta-1,6-N-acetylglucosamine synthase-like glycosyltransferase
MKRLLTFLHELHYELYEVVLVDDYSEDASSSIIAAYKDEHIRCVKAETNHPGKKMVQHTGIGHTNHTVIMVTDADCYGSADWISEMVSASDHADLVLGYAPLVLENTFVSRFATFETWLTAVQYFSYALLGHPYMGVGRNMLFSKKVYEDMGGHNSHLDIVSGDDDLLVNAAANKNNTNVTMEPGSFMYSAAPSTLYNFVKQKTRHVQSSVKYKFKHQVLLLAFALSQMLIYLFLAIGISREPESWSKWLFIWALYIIVKFILAWPWIKKLEAHFLWCYFPLMDVLLAIYYIIMTPLMAFKKDISWKK